VRRSRFQSGRPKYEDITVNALALTPFDRNAREVSVTLHRCGARRLDGKALKIAAQNAGISPRGLAEFAGSAELKLAL
jgi:hypothetical protein